MAGAPNLKNPKITTQGTLRRKCQTGKSLRVDIPPSLAGAPKLNNNYDVSVRDTHCEVMLSERARHTRRQHSFFYPGLDMSGGYGDLAYVMLCYTLVLWGWSVINPGVLSGGTSNSTILLQGYRTGPGHDLLELH